MAFYSNEIDEAEAAKAEASDDDSSWRSTAVKSTRLKPPKLKPVTTMRASSLSTKLPHHENCGFDLMGAQTPTQLHINDVAHDAQ